MSNFDLNNFKDIKKLNINELESLADDIRQKIIQVTEKNGGHLSSNLGIVETTIALHYVFNFPTDKLIFDVGHQCYAHKMLSNRTGRFDNIRVEGGLSGFQDSDESEYDPFSVGHAGTSISAGLGYCTARDLLNEDYNVINVVGDGSFVNGLNLEAITASTTKPKKLIVIFNDNGMSISINKNGLYNLLSRETSKNWYIKNKNRLKRIFGNSFITRALMAIRNFVKRILNRGFDLESFGFKYVGVADGNSIKDMVSILRRVQNIAKHKAVFLHIHTTKGKGLEVAEKQSDIYHGVGKNLEHGSGTFSKTLGEKLNELIDKDSRIVAVTAGMKDGTGLAVVEEKHPSNFTDVGIAEEFAVTLAGGMASGGLKPVVCIYSTFMQRAYDEIWHDVCIQNLPVVLCLDRSGFVGADGKTHQGLFDLSYLTHLPNITILAPCSEEEFSQMLEYALSLNSPVAIRYPKDSAYEETNLVFDGKWDVVKDGGDISVLAVGPRMIKLAKELDQKIGNLKIINARSIKPLDVETLKACEKIITLEENSVIGGFGSYLSEYVKSNGLNKDIISFGAKDEVISHGSIDFQLRLCGLTAEDIYAKLKALSWI